MGTSSNIILALIVFVAVGFCVYLFALQPYKVGNNSMTPIISDGQYILVDKFSYLVKVPDRGEIIIFHRPDDPNKIDSDRIIGLPGEKITITANKVNIDEQPLHEPYIIPGVKTIGGKIIQDDEETTIPPNSYVVMGDNRSYSTDSREWGFVQRSAIIGKFGLTLPLDRLFGLI